ncbi:MAG TPA: ABC transporter permease [Armatimonadota bacterium]|jgi:ribose transport system permease protein
MTETETTITDAPSGARFQWGEALGLLAVYIVEVAILSSMSPYFLQFRNISNILVAASTIGIMSVATTMVIVSGAIDLSIGSVVALSGVAVAQFSHSMPIGWAVAIGLLAGLVVGLINGVAVTYVRINPLIATLGTLSIARGFAFVYSGGLTQTITDERFGFLGRGFLFGVPFQVIVMAALFAVTAWAMRNTVFGRSIYAVGGAPAASRLAGINVRRVQMAVFILSGLSAALGGVFLASQLGAGAPQAATGIEMSVIAAVILGGTSLAGGKGAIVGTLLGVLILGTLNNGLTLLGVSSYYQDVARGTVLLVAVGLDQARLRLANRD